MKMEIHKIERNDLVDIVKDFFEALDPDEDMAIISEGCYVQDILSELLKIDQLVLEFVDFDLESETDYIISITSYGGIFVETIDGEEFYHSDIVMFYEMNKADYCDYIRRNHSTDPVYFKVEEEITDDECMEKLSDEQKENNKVDADESDDMSIQERRDGDMHGFSCSFTDDDGLYKSFSVYTTEDMTKEEFSDIISKFSF